MADFMTYTLVDNVAEIVMNLKDSDDSHEALRAFVEKRQPVYQGR
ncbi:MAG: hypothetical protein U1E97_12530 [Alphaproteobacteria bacterium]